MQESNNTANPGNCCCILPCYCIKWDLTSEPNTFTETFLIPGCCTHDEFIFNGKVTTQRHQCYPLCCCLSYNLEHTEFKRRSDGLIYITTFNKRGGKDYKSFAMFFSTCMMKYADYATRDMTLVNED